MSSTDAILVTMHEVEGLSAEDIADLEGLDIAVVKNVLLTHSKEYRMACRDQETKGSSSNISKNDYEEILIAYKNIALGASDNVHVQEKAGRFLIEEYHGRNERRVKALEKGNYNQAAPRINIGAIVLNQQLEKSREAKKKSLELLAIDV